MRHRTVLFLIDGKRHADEVRTMAVSAGVPDTCFDELVDLGMLVLADPTQPMPLDGPISTSGTLHVELPLDELAPLQAVAPQPAHRQYITQPAALRPNIRSPHIRSPSIRNSRPMPLDDDDDESILPASLPLHLDESVLSDALVNNTPVADSWLPLDIEDALLVDKSLAQARLIMMKAVRQEAPIAGALTLMRLRRAATHTELSLLLPEVEARITKPHRALAAGQTMKRVRDLMEGGD
jgi:hypothetical protein